MTVKAAVILLPLLGVTWLFGFLAVNKESIVFAWIFTILNSLQVTSYVQHKIQVIFMTLTFYIGCFYIDFTCAKKQKG